MKSKRFEEHPGKDPQEGSITLVPGERITLSRVDVAIVELAQEALQNKGLEAPFIDKYPLRKGKIDMIIPQGSADQEAVSNLNVLAGRIKDAVQEAIDDIAS